MARNKILNFEERKKIMECKRLGMSHRKIALLINRSNSVVDNFVRLGDRYAKNRERGRKARLSQLTKLRILCEAEKGNATSIQIKNDLKLDVRARKMRQICIPNHNCIQTVDLLKEKPLDAITTTPNENISEPCLEIKPSPASSPLLESIPGASHQDDTNEGYQSDTYRTSLCDDQDECDIFGTFVASELRGLSNDFLLVRSVKKKIQLAILEAYDNVVKTETGRDYDYEPPVNNNITNREPSRLFTMNSNQIKTENSHIQPDCAYPTDYS